MRYHRLDTLRGFTLVNMIAYHALWDLTSLYGWSLPWFDGLPGRIWQQCICCSFILLSGFCWSLGSRRLSRGLLVFASGALVTVVTSLFLPEERVLCGVLTLLGTCMLIFIPLESFLTGVPPKAGVLISLLLFFVFRHTPEGYLTLSPAFFEKKALRLAIPSGLYRNLLTAYPGFPAPGFSSSDYFPLLPWIFLYLTGIFLYYLAKSQDLLPLLKGKPTAAGALGRHSLILYLLHQPVLYFFLELAHDGP